MWDEKIAPAVEKMISEDAVCAENGMKNLRWYLSNSIDMHMLENSRWDLMHPWDKCSEIEDILSLRLNVISNALKESGNH